MDMKEPRPVSHPGCLDIVLYVTAHTHEFGDLGEATEALDRAAQFAFFDGAAPPEGKDAPFFIQDERFSITCMHVGQLKGDS